MVLLYLGLLCGVAAAIACLATQYRWKFQELSEQVEFYKKQWNDLHSSSSEEAMQYHRKFEELSEQATFYKKQWDDFCDSWSRGLEERQLLQQKCTELEEAVVARGNEIEVWRKDAERWEQEKEQITKQIANVEELSRTWHTKIVNRLDIIRQQQDSLKYVIHNTEQTAAEIQDAVNVWSQGTAGFLISTDGLKVMSIADGVKLVKPGQWFCVVRKALPGELAHAVHEELPAGGFCVVRKALLGEHEYNKVPAQWFTEVSFWDSERHPGNVLGGGHGLMILGSIDRGEEVHHETVQ